MLTLPRGLILLASAWLFLSWIGSMGVHPPLVAATSSYSPAVRMMILSSAVGALVAWPLMRMSQAPATMPIRAVLLDLAVVLGMTNMVLWPLRLVTPWPPERMACVMVLLSIWIIATGAIVSIAWPSPRSMMRIIGMLAALLIACGWIVLRAVPGVGDALAPFPSVHGGPFESILALATPGGAPPTFRDWSAVQGAAGIALALWAVALVCAALRGRRRADGLPGRRPPVTLATWN